MSARDNIVGTLKDGRTIVEKETDSVVGSGTVFVEVTLEGLNTVDKVLEIHVTQSSPKTTVGPAQMIEVSGNVVGFTLTSVGATTTVTTNVAAIGY